MILRHGIGAVFVVDDVEYADAGQAQSRLVVDEESRGRDNATRQVGRVYGTYDGRELDHVVPHTLLGQQTERLGQAVDRLAGAEGSRRSVQVVRIGPAL